jgi:BTB/POZ domain.
MEALINFAYSGRVTIHSQNVQSLMVVASFLQMQKVADACADFLKKRFHPNNVLGKIKLETVCVCVFFFFTKFQVGRYLLVCLTFS